MTGNSLSLTWWDSMLPGLGLILKAYSNSTPMITAPALEKFELSL